MEGGVRETQEFPVWDEDGQTHMHFFVIKDYLLRLFFQGLILLAAVVVLVAPSVVPFPSSWMILDLY